MSLENQPLGAHLSISKGFDKMISDGQSIGCTAIQMFLHSNRQWNMRDLSPEQITDFTSAVLASSIKSFVVHASYLVNLGSSQALIRKKSLDMLIKELEQCAQLHIPYLVLHPGSYGDTSLEACIDHIIDGINKAFAESDGTSMLLLENTAGQGTAVGFKLEQLKTIYTHIHNKKRIGICIDTCHAFAAGYDFTTPATYRSFWQEFDAIIGIEQLKVFHLNDSKRELGSHVDRHEQIGKGKIGIEAFRLIMNDSRFQRVPKILETPYDNYARDALRLYKHNLDLLRSLIGKKE